MGARKRTTKKERKESWEEAIVEGLRRHPEMRERFEAILKISDAKEERLLNVDEAEERLIQEVRGLGNQAMSDWAVAAEERMAQQFKSEHPKAGVKKKALEVVVSVWGGER
jgi:hypothetical protein